MSVHIFILIYVCNHIQNLHGSANYDIYRPINTPRYHVGNRQDSLHMYYWNNFKPIKSNVYPLVKTILSSHGYKSKPPTRNLFYNFFSKANYQPRAMPVVNDYGIKTQPKNSLLMTEKATVNAHVDAYPQYYKHYNLDYPDRRTRQAIPFRTSMPVNPIWNLEQHSIIIPYVYPINPLLLTNDNKIKDISNSNSNSFNSIEKSIKNNVKNTTIPNIMCGIQTKENVSNVNKVPSRICLSNKYKFNGQKLSTEHSNSIINLMNNNNNLDSVNNKKFTEVQTIQKFGNYISADSSRYPINQLRNGNHNVNVNHSMTPLNKFENYEKNDRHQKSVDDKVEKSVKELSYEKPFYPNKLIIMNDEIDFMPIIAPYMRENHYLNESLKLSHERNSNNRTMNVVNSSGQLKHFKSYELNRLPVVQQYHNTQIHDFFTLKDAITSTSTPSKRNENNLKLLNNLDPTVYIPIDTNFKTNYEIDTVYNNKTEEYVNYHLKKNLHLKYNNNSVNATIHQNLESTTSLPLTSIVSYYEGYNDTDTMTTQTVLDDAITTTEASITPTAIILTINCTYSNNLQNTTVEEPISENRLTLNEKSSPNKKSTISFMKIKSARQRVRVNTRQLNNQTVPERTSLKFIAIPMKNNTSLFAKQGYKYIKKMKHVKSLFSPTKPTTTSTIIATTLTTTIIPMSILSENITATNHFDKANFENIKSKHTRRRKNKYNTKRNSNNVSLKTIADEIDDIKNNKSKINQIPDVTRISMVTTKINATAFGADPTIKSLYSINGTRASTGKPEKTQKLKFNSTIENQKIVINKFSKRRLTKLRSTDVRNIDVPPLPIEMYFKESKKRRIFNE